MLCVVFDVSSSFCVDRRTSDDVFSCVLFLFYYAICMFVLYVLFVCRCFFIVVIVCDLLLFVVSLFLRGSEDIERWANVFAWHSLQEAVAPGML